MFINILIYTYIFAGAPPLQSIPPECVNIAVNLTILALFCGYSNIQIDLSPQIFDLQINKYINVSNFSIKNKPPKNGQNEKKNSKKTDANDDEWLTNSFFISLSKQRLDILRGALTTAPPEHGSNVPPKPLEDPPNNEGGNMLPGNIPSTNIYQQSNILNLNSLKLDKHGDSREYKEFHDTNYSLWKSRQFLGEIYLYIYICIYMYIYIRMYIYISMSDMYFYL
jgi:hypothetical protein